MLVRGPLHELICVVRNNAVIFAGAAVVLYFLRKAGCIFQTGVFLFYPVGLCADAGCTSVVETVFPIALSFFPGRADGRCW